MPLIRFEGFIDRTPGTLEARFECGVTLQLHRGHGRSDLVYAMHPYKEGQSFLPSVRRAYQRVALEEFLSGTPHQLVQDRDGDLRAVIGVK